MKPAFTWLIAVACCAVAFAQQRYPNADSLRNNPDIIWIGHVQLPVYIAAPDSMLKDSTNRYLSKKGVYTQRHFFPAMQIVSPKTDRSAPRVLTPLSVWGDFIFTAARKGRLTAYSAPDSLALLPMDSVRERTVVERHFEASNDPTTPGMVARMWMFHIDGSTTAASVLDGYVYFDGKTERWGFAPQFVGMRSKDSLYWQSATDSVLFWIPLYQQGAVSADPRASKPSFSLGLYRMELDFLTPIYTKPHPAQTKLQTRLRKGGIYLSNIKPNKRVPRKYRAYFRRAPSAGHFYLDCFWYWDDKNARLHLY